jgi:hypothetical protein
MGHGTRGERHMRLQSETIEIFLLCGIAVCLMLSFEWITAEDLRRAALILIGWSVGSTLLVGSAGLLVAAARSHRARGVGSGGR